MMEIIRSWRTPSFGGFGRAALERIRSWRISHFLGWGIGILLIGMLTGAMAVVLPPMASIGLVALAGVVLLWAMPDLHVVPEKLLRRMFFILVAVQLCVPAYYAIDTGYLPWISVRRFFALAVILLFALTVSGSQQARNKIADTLRNNRMLAFLSFGFLVMLFLSVFTASNRAQSLSGLFDSFLTWYVPLFACILVVRTKDDVVLLLKIVAIAVIVDAIGGVLEFYAQHRIYFDIFPKSVLDAMLAANPALDALYSTPQFRNGIYRASSIYSVPLSFGEFAAMAAPIGAYFIFHGESIKWRLFGFLSVASSVVTLLVSGARGGFIAFLVAMPVMLLLWTIRYSRANRGSLVGTIMGILFSTGFIAVLGLIAFSRRLSNIVLGGGDTAGSDNARFIQFKMATPHILSNPVTGHGRGSSGELIGFYNPGSSIPTVDSYVITLLVEQGIPGLLLFFGTIAFGIWIGVRLYINSSDERAALGGPIACSIIAFGVYRIVLSQSENHTLFFLMTGLVFAISTLSRDWIKRTQPYLPFTPSGARQRPVTSPGKKLAQVRQY